MTVLNSDQVFQVFFNWNHDIWSNESGLICARFCFRSNENLNVPSHHHPPKSQSISPLAMERQNGFSNGLKETRRIESYAETKNFTDVVDKGMSHTAFPDFSPIRPVIRSPAKGGLNSSNDDSFSSTYPNSSYRSSSNYGKWSVLYNTRSNSN